MQKFYKRIAAAFTLFCLATQVSAASFADVNGTGYENAFAYLSTQDIVHGYPDGTGKPNGPLNRAEALKVIMTSRPEYKERADWFKNHMPPLSLFYDVGLSEWYAPYIEAAFEKRVVTGYDDGTFRPARLVSVEEAITLLMRSFGEVGSTGGVETSAYIDNHSGQWYTPYINAAIKRNLIERRGKMFLGTAITRGQFFEMVYRMHKVKAEGLVAFDDSGYTYATTATIHTINAVQPSTVSTAMTHPHGSEKYFSVTIPAAGIKDLTVTHPGDPFSKDGVLAPLQSGVGHLFSYPGKGGKIMIYGHSSGYPWDVSQFTKIFRRINQLKPGDTIYVTFSGEVHTYEVTFEEAVPAGDTSRFQDNGSGEELILYTCWPPDSIQQRYLVHAIPVSSAVAMQ